MITLSAIFGIFLTAVQIVPGSGANQHGRTGNEHLKQDQFEEAATAYQEGLSGYPLPEESDRVYHGLQNNLGLTLHRQEKFEEADRAFKEALAYAPNDDTAAMTAFNAGNNAFTSQQLEQALEHYQAALMANPNNEDAKFNFEFVSRQLQEQQNQEQQQDNNEQKEEEDQNEQQQNQQQENEEQQNQDSEQDEDSEQNEEEQQKEDQNEQQQNQEQNGQQEQEGEQPEPQEMPLTREQAERILEALENEEEQLLRELQKAEGRPRRVAKDW